MERRWTFPLILLVALISGLIGIYVGNRSLPACHAMTEDSYISDCDYHNGAWWHK